MSTGRIAILIDGGFFLKRLPRLVPENRCDSPGKIVACIRHLCRRHVKLLTDSDASRWQQHVYRIFFYDAVPYEGKAHHPIDNRPIDFGKSRIARDRLELFELLRKERKLALRLGKVIRDHDWAIAPTLTKKLLRTRNWAAALDRLELDDAAAQSDAPVALNLSRDEARSLIELRKLWRTLDGGTVSLGLRQKGVDMRIGLDIAPDCRVIAGDGTPHAGLFAIGPVSRAALWEITAIPDIREQTMALAERLDGLHAGGNHWAIARA